MTQTRDLMTADPKTIRAEANLDEAARLMRDADIGDVIVCKGEEICGIITDRDIVVRAAADGKDMTATTAGDICSGDLVTLEPTASVDDAVRLMRDRAIRRIPVVESGRPVGIVSIGDLAVARDGDSALADISAAPANT